jgi:hypothetical protein
MHRFSLLAAAAVVVLAVAGLASATPRLIISGTTVQVLEEKTDAAPLKITIYVPSGYTASVAQTPGSQIGTVHADLQALAISPDAIIQAEGTVLAGDTSNAQLQGAATQCTGSPAHAAIWLLHITVSGTTLDVPEFVDPTAGAETALGAAKIQLCLPDPYENAGPARAAFGSKIINAQMTLNPTVIGAPTSGSYLWRSIVTPWNPAAPAPDAAHTVEAQSFVTLPQAATLKAKVKHTGKGKKRKSTVTLSGTVKEGSSGVSGAKVDLFAGGKKVASVTTSSSGTFSKSFALKKKTTFQAKVTVAQRDASCQSPLPTTQVPGGCASATAAGWSATATTTAKP